MEEMCGYVSAPSGATTPEERLDVAVHRAAYTLWRLNWIHPFEQGNGRTSRAAAYVVLSGNVGYRLHGRRTIPEMIASELRFDYLDGLEAADAAWKTGVLDVRPLEEMLVRALERQLDAS
jgi:fido (protein-threonine AMPylation protein)